jgi:hypothetical protein
MTWHHLLDSAAAGGLLAAVGVALFGYGSLLRRLLGIRTAPASLHQPLWAGWTLLLMVLAVTHLFVALNGSVALLILVAGLALAAGAAHELPAARQSLAALPPRTRLPLILGLLPLLAWLLARAMTTPTLPDSGGYHFPAITWINDYAIVPGLGNLNARLALYQSSFLLNAWLNFEPWFNHGYALLTPLLTLLTLLTVVERAAANRTRAPRVALFSLLFVPLIFAVTIELKYVAGPSADSISALVMLTATLLLLQTADDQLHGRTIDRFDLSLLVLLAAALITMKASSAVFAALLTLALVPLLWPQRAALQAPLLRAVGISLLNGLVFLWRNVLLSGYPLFPLTIGGLNVEWRVPPAVAANIQLTINAHARYFQRFLQDRSVLNEPWLPIWLARVQRDWPETLVALAVISALAVLCVLLLPAGRLRRDPRIWLTLLPSGAALLFWAVNAPAPRFAFGLLFSLPLLLAWALLSSSRAAITPRLTAALLALALLPAAAGLIAHRADALRLSLDGFQPLPVSELTTVTLPGGLTLAQPTNKRHCWDAPALCSPNPPAELRLIGASPQEGFSVLPAAAGR